MEETLEIQLNVKAPENKDIITPLTTPSASLLPITASQHKSLKWWTHILLYSFLVLAGQSTAVLLGRLYCSKGGLSKWMATLVQFAGFPVLIPFYFMFPSKTNPKTEHAQHQQSDIRPSPPKLGGIYISLGLLIAFNGMLFATGIHYLPVSTFTLITASQLAFTALFAFLLVGQKFTPYIVNSLVILTISSILLVSHNESSNNNNDVTKSEHAIGIVCAVGASAGIGLLLPLTQFFLQKVIKESNFKAIYRLMLAELVVASCASIVGLFASGDWKRVKGEKEVYMLGKESFMMILIGTALSWQVFYLGTMKLLIEVSSLFCNVIGALGLPIVPVLAVCLFHEKLDGVKVVAMLLAIWGFVSYAYQCYLDNQGRESKDDEIR